jgi:hypothetical protein
MLALAGREATLLCATLDANHLKATRIRHTHLADARALQDCTSGQNR